MAPSNHLLDANWRPAPLIDLMEVVTTDGLGSSLLEFCKQKDAFRFAMTCKGTQNWFDTMNPKYEVHMDVKSMKDLDCALRVHEQGRYKMAFVTVFGDKCGKWFTNQVLLNKLSGLFSLTKLVLDFCLKITDVSPLSGLASLTDLNLRYSKVTDVSPLSGLTSLTYLDLRYSKVTDVSPLSGLTSLTPVLTSLTYFGA